MSKNDHVTQENLKYVSCDLGNAKNDHVTQENDHVTQEKLKLRNCQKFHVTQEIVCYVFTYSI